MLLRLLLAGAIGCTGVMAQAGCPGVSFQTASWASLTPTAGSHLNLLRQNDGSYTAYETGNESPYTIVRTIPNFQKQLSVCQQAALVNMDLQPVTVRTGSGGYLMVGNVTSSNYSGIDVAEFDADLNLISEAQYPIDEPGPIAIADVNGDGKPDILVATDAPPVQGSISNLEVFLGSGGTAFSGARRLYD